MHITSSVVLTSTSPATRKTDTSPTHEFTHSEFWFVDGNIVLAAGNVLFKVHRGQLERHSEVFRDIFALPQPQESTKIEDCPMMELHDSPLDVLHLLRALYDGLYYQNLNADDFGIISSVLRLSTKYFIEHLRNRCTSRLAMDWPESLATWDQREHEATDNGGRYNPRARFAHPIRVINFAREMGLQSILPAAFYDLCRYGPSKIIGGVPAHPPILECFGGLSRQTGARLLPASLSSSDIEATAQLTFADMRVALAGRETAQRVVANFIEEELSSRSIAPDCHNKDRDGGRVCRESFYFIMLNILRSIGGIASGRDCDPLYTLTQAVDMMSRNDFSDGVQFCSLKICAACKTDFTLSVRAAREHVWSQIPSWFGLENFSKEGKDV